MKRTGLLLVFLLLLCSHCFAREGQDSGIKFSDIYGEVSVRPNAEDDDAYEFAELDMPLLVDDRIRTKEESGAILSMADMSTFVIKPESIVILNTPTGKENKIELVAGNIWVNVKKMVGNGSMEVEMSQAVAGIKGTNITCSTSRSEDRIQVLRGMAEVLIKESREKVAVKEGEELIVKAGGKTEKIEINISNEQQKWENETSRMGETIQMNEIPEVLKSILDSEASEFARINESFNKLVAMSAVEEADVAEIRRDAERFIGVILEDNLILNTLRKKVESAAAAPGVTAADNTRLASFMREIAAVQTKQDSYRSQISKIIRYQFKFSSLTEDFGPEIEMLRTEFAQVTAEVDSVRAVLSANPSGQGQDWFREANMVCANAISSLDQLTQKIIEVLNRAPGNVELSAMLKAVNDQRTSISTMIRSLTVVEIPAATMVEMSQIDDVLSDNLVILQKEIADYNAILDAASVRANLTAMERRLKSSLRIMDSFARVKRLYTKAQRLYDNTVKAAARSAFKTSEHEELESTWQNISDRFQQLGIVAEQLQTNIDDLERQLAEFLK